MRPRKVPAARVNQTMQNHHQPCTTKSTRCPPCLSWLSPAPCLHGHRCAQIKPFALSRSLVCRLCKTNPSIRPVGASSCSLPASDWPSVRSSTLVCPGISILRHLLAMPNTGSSWSERRFSNSGVRSQPLTLPKAAPSRFRGALKHEI